MTEKAYWILKLGNLILKDTGTKRAFTKFLGEARRFGSLEEAFGFAFGDRPMRGDTSAQKIFSGHKSPEHTSGQSAAMTFHLGQELTSVLENTNLWREEVAMKKFRESVKMKEKIG